MEKRLGKLLEAGVVSALVCMVKQESPALTEACREFIARYQQKKQTFFFGQFFCRFFYTLCPCRVFLALVDRQEDRGIVVAQGGGKVKHNNTMCNCVSCINL